MSGKAEYAIIGSFEKFNILKFIYKQILYKIKCCIYFEKYNIKYKNINYHEYTLENWLADLKTADFVIFNQDHIETQGLAMAEAWAANKPTFIKYNVNEYGGITSPYLTEQCGYYYKNYDELENYIKEFYDKKTKFEPRKFVKDNLSDKKSVKDLIEIFNSIGIS